MILAWATGPATAKISVSTRRGECMASARERVYQKAR
jgi:hypothetical protein